MSNLVLLCRHGNTFNKGEKVVMVGAKEDLPLTVHGLEQAEAVAEVIKNAKLRPERIWCGPLLRTKVFAEIVSHSTGGAESVVDPRLIEFDYGAWGGLSNEEIVAGWGSEALERWQEGSVRPAGVVFKPSEQIAAAEARSVLDELRGCSGTTVVVTSNGRLREFGKILGGSNGSTSGSFKVRTGHLCVVSRENDVWHLLGWDLSPRDAASLLAQRATVR